MSQPPVITVQRDYYGKPFRVVLENLAGVWVVRDTQTAVYIPVLQNGNTLSFIIDSENFSNISVATNDSAVTVVLQDVDFTTGLPVGPSFTVGFTNGLSSQVYVTQTHFILVQVTIKSVTDKVTFYLS